MAFGGSASAAQPNPLGITLGGSGTSKFIPQDDNFQKPSAKNSLVYEQLTLGAFVGFPLDINNVDTGVLITSVPVVRQHGLPINFGPGRGNWTARDARFMRFEVECQNPAAPAPPG